MEEIVQEVELDYHPRDVFLDFHEREQRWAVIVAHRRCGKTVACINELIYRALTENKENGRYFYLAPYLSQSKSIAWDYLVRYAQPVLAKANQSELWVELINTGNSFTTASMRYYDSPALLSIMEIFKYISRLVIKLYLYFFQDTTMRCGAFSSPTTSVLANLGTWYSMTV